MNRINRLHNAASATGRRRAWVLPALAVVIAFSMYTPTASAVETTYQEQRVEHRVQGGEDLAKGTPAETLEVIASEVVHRQDGAPLQIEKIGDAHQPRMGEGAEARKLIAKPEGDVGRRDDGRIQVLQRHPLVQDPVLGEPALPGTSPTQTVEKLEAIREDVAFDPMRHERKLVTRWLPQNPTFPPRCRAG